MTAPIDAAALLHDIGEVLVAGGLAEVHARIAAAEHERDSWRSLIEYALRCVDTYERNALSRDDWKIAVKLRAQELGVNLDKEPRR